jgi:hypothetical protein
VERKIKQEFKLAGEFLDLRRLDTNCIVEHLEEQIRLRETSVEKKLSKLLKQQ